MRERPLYNEKMGNIFSRESQFVAQPFYIFITILLGGLGYRGVLMLWQGGQGGGAAVAAGLVLAHILLHWANRQTVRTTRWWLFYHLSQTALIAAVVALFLVADFDMGVNFLGSAVVSMIGEVVGLWGNTRRAFYLGVVYALLAAGGFLSVGNEESLSYLAIAFINGGFVILLIYVFNQQLAERERAESLAQTLAGANEQLTLYAEQIESLTLTTERQRMARELHDTLAQGVAGLVLQLEAVKAHLQEGNGERAADIVGGALVRARGTLGESRAAIDDLRTYPQNLAEAIQQKGERFTQATGIPCEISIDLGNCQVGGEVGNHLQQLIGEGLSNVARHAEAGQVAVAVWAENGRLTVTIRDDGKGFDTAQAIGSGHYGVLGMRERARLMAGALKIESSLGGGSLICLTLPLTAVGEKI